MDVESQDSKITVFTWDIWEASETGITEISSRSPRIQHRESEESRNSEEKAELWCNGNCSLEGSPGVLWSVGSSCSLELGPLQSCVNWSLDAGIYETLPVTDDNRQQHTLQNWKPAFLSVLNGWRCVQYQEGTDRRIGKVREGWCWPVRTWSKKAGQTQWYSEKKMNYLFCVCCQRLSLFFPRGKSHSDIECWVRQTLEDAGLRFWQRSFFEEVR